MLKKSILVFLVVADCGSMNKAALQLFTSPTAVMNEINKLESELGFALFHRSNRGLTLTEAGKSLHRDAKYLAYFSQKAITNAKLASNPEKISIRIGSSYLRPCEPFFRIWNQIKGQHKQFQITVVPFNDSSLDEIFHSLGKNFDIMISICDITHWKKHYQFVKLWDSKFTISVSQSHPLATKKQLRLDDLFGERILFIETGTSRIIDGIRSYLEKEYPDIQIVNYLPHYDLNIFNLCAQEDILLLSTDMWEHMHPSLVQIPIEWDYSIPYGIMYPLNPAPYLIQFIHLIRSANLKNILLSSNHA